MKFFGVEVITPALAAQREARRLQLAADLDNAVGVGIRLGNEKAALLSRFELTDRERMEAYELLKEARAARDAAAARADLADRVVTAQSAHVESLQKSNDKLVEAMMEMRRIGYGLIRDVLDENLSADATSTTDEDEDAVERDPDTHRRTDE